MQTLLLVVMVCSSTFLTAQPEEVGDSLVDNNLTMRLVDDKIKRHGEFTICIGDTAGGPCIQNLVTGLKIKVWDASGELLWEGKATGRLKSMRLPRAMPRAARLELEAFKPYVVNKSTGTRIHQDEKIHVKHAVK